MQSIYLVLLASCSLAMFALIVRRLLAMARTPRPGWGRILNESVWTLIPVVVVLALWWRAV